MITGSREYIDFSRSYFRMDLNLKKTDRGNLVAGSQRWLAPNAFHTIIKQPSIYVNGTLTTEQTDTYAYKAYLETILNYGTEDEETILKPQGYYSALNHPGSNLTANQIDSATPHANYTALSKGRKKAVDGLLEMKDKTTGGKTIQLFGLPHVDLFNTGRMLIPGVNLKMRFTLNDPKFFMNGLTAVATDVRLQAGDLKMKFYACMVKVRSDVYNKIATARLQKNLDVFYPTVRSEIRTYTLQNNYTNFEATDVFKMLSQAITPTILSISQNLMSVVSNRLWKGKSTRINLCNLLQTTVNMTCQGITDLSVPIVQPTEENV